MQVAKACSKVSTTPDGSSIPQTRYLPRNYARCCKCTALRLVNTKAQLPPCGGQGSFQRLLRDSFSQSKSKCRDGSESVMEDGNAVVNEVPTVGILMFLIMS